jgi:hypothetical protein
MFANIKSQELLVSLIIPGCQRLNTLNKAIASAIAALTSSFKPGSIVKLLKVSSGE